jgi:hypothetical protein
MHYLDGGGARLRHRRFVFRLTEHEDGSGEASHLINFVADVIAMGWVSCKSRWRAAR